MRSSLHNLLLRGTLAVLALHLVSCGFADSSHRPAIELNRIPRADAGGPASVGTIDGRVVGARPGQRVVLFARSGPWWVQPFADRPFTTIASDGSWSSTTHLGTDYAALLVEPEYEPPSSTDALPSVGPGVVAIAVARGEPAVWRQRWFVVLCLLLAMLAVFAWYRFRMHELARRLNVRFEERLAERTRIAHELHDTLLQGFVSASMQLHVAIDGLPEESPQRQSLARVLTLMRSVVEEGRSAVAGLRSTDLGSDDLERAFTTIRQELAGDDSITYRAIVEGRKRPLHPVIRDEVYRIGREALANAFRHSNAHAIEVELRYGSSRLSLLVRDDGRGIDPQLLESGRDGHFGLSGMRERAEAIGAQLHLRSRASAGTEVELTVPGKVAFQDHHGSRSWSFFSRTRNRA